MARSRTVDTAQMGGLHPNALQLTAEEMREAGYRTDDMLCRP